MIQLSLWSLPPLLALLVGVRSYSDIRAKSRVPGKQPLLVLLAAVIFWSAAALLSSILTDPQLQLLARQLAYVGIVLAPVMWFVFALNYTRRQMRVSRRLLNGVLVVPVITVALVVTNPWHGLIWSDLNVSNSGGHIAIVTQHGPWFYAHAAYSYVLLVVATSILAFAISQSATQRTPLLAVIFAPALVALANLFYLSPWNPLPWLDLTILGFAAAAIVLNNGVLRHGMLDTVPVIRERVVEQLRDGVAVVDHSGYLVDLNKAALQILKAERAQIHGNNICDFVKSVALEDLLGQGGRDTVGITLAECAYDICPTVLDPSDPQSRVALVFRDITNLRRTEVELRNTKHLLDQLAHTDSLTELHNRRFFMQRLDEEVERVRRHGGKLSLLLFDLDHFKRINDTHGHDAGDRILKAVGRTAERVKRLTDVLARVGGEEFAMLLPETDIEGAMGVARRLRKAVERLHITDPTATGIKITSSVGVASITQLSGDLDGVLKQADEALYRAKGQGRNRVCFAPI